ncbi:hypothetical protein E2C01_051802 [Portunus trituberculatus]|uniref:Uncharacterized protein n=1 Tax=Portunus trituberculatus TaxID=210409 RepID=A0A5B7GMQ5_PORTR|nr:hypothetical protein [Portunus trituberculatus]
MTTPPTVGLGVACAQWRGPTFTCVTLQLSSPPLPHDSHQYNRAVVIRASESSAPKEDRSRPLISEAMKVGGSEEDLMGLAGELTYVRVKHLCSVVSSNCRLLVTQMRTVN